ncbi:MAG: cation:proton antiporter [Actinomycetota bacterium]|nr:cation:proton antiporter [Actinomycetota bacterium]
MPDVSVESLLVVSVVAAAAPLFLGLVPRLSVPAVVLEILAGVALGPAVLGLIEIDLPVQILALIGLAFLLFLAGLEIDVARLRGRLLRLALLGYVVSLALGVPIGLGLDAAGLVEDPALLAIALSATGLGLVVPVLKDARRADSDVGQTIIVAATVADLGAVVALSLLFSTEEGSAGSRAVLLAAFVALVAITAAVVWRAGRSMRLGDVLVRLQDTTAEIRVRFAILLLIGFTALAEQFGLESILGAFVAGVVVVSLVDRDSSSHPHFRTKLEAIGFGLLIPVFFISSGAQLDVRGLVDDPAALLRVPVFLVALLVIRGLPALLYLSTLGRVPTMAAGRTAAGDVAAVHRGRHPDRHRAGRDLRADRDGAGRRRSAVGAAVPGHRPRPATPRRAPGNPNRTIRGATRP